MVAKEGKWKEGETREGKKLEEKKILSQIATVFGQHLVA